MSEVTPCVPTSAIVRLPKPEFSAEVADERAQLLSVAATERVDYVSNEAKTGNESMKLFSVGSGAVFGEAILRLQ